MPRILAALAALVLLGLAAWFWQGNQVAIDPYTTPPPAEEIETPASDQRVAGTQEQEGRQALAGGSQTPDPRATKAEDKQAAVDPERATLRVSLRYAKSKQPARSAVVQVEAGGGPFTLRHRRRTDARGLVVFSNIDPGPVLVRALRGVQQSVFLAPGQERDLTLSIPEGIDLQIKVVDPDERGIAGARIWLSQRWSHSEGAVATETDAEGVAVLAQVSENCRIAAQHPDYAPSGQFSLRKSRGGSQRIQITLRPGGYVLRGRVIDRNGEGVADAQILVGKEVPSYTRRRGDGNYDPGPPPRLLRSGPDGRFFADALGPEPGEIQVRHPDFAPLQQKAQAHKPPSPELSLVLMPGAEVRGLVRDTQGKPLRARIWGGTRGRFAAAQVRAGRDGSYHLRSLPAGKVPMQARHGQDVTKAELVLQAGIIHNWDPVIGPQILAPGTHLLRGRIVDHQGQALPRWRIAAQANGETGLKTLSVRSDAKGQFELKVPFAEMRVWAHPPGKHQGLPYLVRDGVRADAGELLLTVLPESMRAAKVRGRILDPGGRPLSASIEIWHASLKIWRSTASDAKGRFEIRNVPAGRLELKISHADHPWRKLDPLELQVGGDQDLGDLILDAGARIKGLVTPPTGRPLPAELRILVIDAKTSREAGVAAYAGGRYRSNALRPGNYTLYLRGTGVAMTPVAFRLSDGQSLERNLRLQAAAPCKFEFEMGPGTTRPQHLSVMIRRTDGSLVEALGLPRSKALHTRCSLTPGIYTLKVYSTGPTGPILWFSHKLQIRGTRAEEFRFTLRNK